MRNEELGMRRFGRGFLLGSLALIVLFTALFLACTPLEGDIEKVHKEALENSGGNKLPALTGTVSISGTAQVGQTLTAITTSLDGTGTITYQWKRGGTTDIGSNSSSYTILSADIGSTIAVTVTRAGYSGSVTSNPTSAVPIPALSGTVSITGSTIVGETLTADTGSLGGTGIIGYQWMRGGNSVGTNSNTYVLVNADEGFTITVTVTRSDNTGSVTSSPTATVIYPALTGTVSITVSGAAPGATQAAVGDTLTANTDSLGGSGTFFYQWKLGSTNIGTNSSTYVIQPADAAVGAGNITLTVTRSLNSGSVTSGSSISVLWYWGNWNNGSAYLALEKNGDFELSGTIKGTYTFAGADTLNFIVSHVWTGSTWTAVGIPAPAKYTRSGDTWTITSISDEITSLPLYGPLISNAMLNKQFSRVP